MPPEDPFDVWRKRAMGDFPSFFADFEKEFARMQGMVSKMMEDAMKHAEGPRREQPFVYGFSMRIGKDGVPHLTPFGSAAPGFVPGAPGTPTIDEGSGALDDLVREPLSDVMESEDEVSVTVELPGAEKGDLSLRVAEDTVTVRVDKGARRYHKRIQLPGRVDPASAKATFKNGILDVTLRREKADQDDGHTVAIE